MLACLRLVLREALEFNSEYQLGLDAFCDLTNHGPAGSAKHQDGKVSLFQVLLIAKVGVGGDQQLVALLFCQANQIAIGHG